ncbi:MAG: hypothetical protein RIQ93_798 [Verrucomicrobiota bacterium]|jgi:murein DD-endopeptidase MepM/ murein hydrolase activator NlpD
MMVALALLALELNAQERLILAWPTPNPAWWEGRPVTDFLQHAGSGDAQSGAFGGVRSGGTRFHEGLDLKPIARDRRGEAMDDVLVVMDGVVRHINSSAGESSYGRYVVVEHPGAKPAVYTLYGHLARIAPGLKVGEQITRGYVLGMMGHSSGGYVIPKERAHLHFEIGVVMTRDFQAWYGGQKFGSRNQQGMWNGLNLMGIDPLAFYEEWRHGRVNTFQDHFARMETVVRLRIATRTTPNFVTRYPALLTREMPVGPLGGWEIRFNWTGLPFAWTPLGLIEMAGLPSELPKIIEVDAAVGQRSKSLVVKKRGEWAVGKDLKVALQQLFGPALRF